MAAPSQLVGQKLGHYLILEQIGAGGMGVVYRAHHEQLDRNVALKVLAPGTLVNDAARKRLRKEALALAKLNHPNVETVYDFDTQDEVDFLVMELIPGVTLDDKLRAGPLPETEITTLATQLAEGLAAAHEQGVFHCDLKPSNLRITPDGRLKILDFGIANLLHPQSETADTISLGDLRAAGGTLPYMAPEQFLGKRVDGRVDIFAMGAVLYEMATAKRAFPQEDRGELTDAILHKDPTPPKRLSPQVGSAMQRLIMKALQKDANKRYQSASELLADLARVGESGWLPALRGFANRRTVAVIGVCALVAALLFSWGRLRRHPPPATEQVLVGDFENRTGEAVFDQTLRELLSTSLEQSDYLRVFPYSQLPDVLQRMNKAPGAKIDEEVGREILQREGLQALLSGSISKLGNSYVLLVKAVSPTAESLASTQKEISDVSQLPSAVDAITKKIRRSLGESAAGVEKNFQPLAKVTSPSLEAIQYFSFGKQRLYAGNPREAAVLFRKAVELDPNFAISHEYLAIAYEQLGDLFRAGKSFSDASRLVDHVTERERQKILGDFFLFNQDYDQAIQHFQLLAQMQPQDPAVHLNLAESYSGKFQFDGALTEVQEAVRLKPDAGPINNLADIYFLKGDTDRALDVALKLLQRNPNDGRALEKAATCYLVKGQLEEAKRRYEQLVTLGGESESEGRAGLADLALARGRQHEARAQLQAGVVADEKLANLYSSAVKQFALAALDPKATDKKLAATINRIEAAGSSSDLILLLGRIYARQHRYGAADKQLHTLEQMVAQDQVPTPQSFVHLLKADIALAGGRPKQAVAEAKLAVAYENSTFAAESLAHAYRTAGMYSEAAHEFEEVLHRCNERRASYDGPAFYKVVEDHYWIAVSYQEMGRNDLARSHLETLLTYWSQADPELAMYRDAQRRLELLRRSSVGSGTPAPAT